MADAPVVICGAGIIGTSIAYQLALRGIRASLVDKVGLCPAASGAICQLPRDCPHQSDCC